MTAEIKLRMGSFRESDIKIYEGNINRYSAQAIEVRCEQRSICSKPKESWSPSARPEDAPTLKKTVRVCGYSLPQHGAVTGSGNKGVIQGAQSA